MTVSTQLRNVKTKAVVVFKTKQFIQLPTLLPRDPSILDTKYDRAQGRTLFLR